MTTSTKESEYWESVGSPRVVLAPMVAASSVAFRLLCRRYGAEMCSTPMINAKMYTTHAKYRRDVMSDLRAAEAGVDRPLAAQFCGDDPEVLLLAARGVENCVDAVDLNLGCPQGIAKRGRYGAFLLEDEDRVCEIIKTLAQNVAVPVTCKIRLFDDLERTLVLCRRLADAGVASICVHGRTKAMKGQLVGEADWAAIATIRRALDRNIPIIANGGVESFDDVEKCLAATEASAVMISEAALSDPRVLGGTSTKRKVDVAAEYLEIASSKVAIDSTKLAEARGHLVKILFEIIQADGNHAFRDALIQANTWSDLRDALGAIRRHCHSFVPTTHPRSWYRRHRRLEEDSEGGGGGENHRQDLVLAGGDNGGPLLLKKRPLLLLGGGLLGTQTTTGNTFACLATNDDIEEQQGGDDHAGPLESLFNEQ
mmetsp:Transcript_20198/g.65056  ORF Transcript_20198/g.65056 Transcript_20198/m.65056 type:complete len:426 (-) Transcript_20198:46-1323(-)